MRRDCAARPSRGGVSAERGAALLAQAHQRLACWHRVREGPLQQATLRASMTPVRPEVERLWEQGSRGEVPTPAGTCRAILKSRAALWTCVQVAGVEPTNTAAERSSRPGVLGRQGRCGTHSEAGSRFVESLLTVVSTLNQQQRNVLAYLTAACEAALQGAAAPSLLPANAQKAQAAA